MSDNPKSEIRNPKSQMRIQPFAVLLRRMLKEYEHSQSIFGIHRSLFYTPRQDAAYAMPDFREAAKYLATPIGPSAGPHTQLSQNIIAAWLCGGRFIELKTVQIMDELEIPRPCIDMTDEGYNVEWSQELKLEQSAQEYINAWAAIHVLRRLLGWEETPFGTIFDMSIGYNLEGIKAPRMSRFMDTLTDASEEIAEIQAILKAQFPQFTDLPIPPRITNSVTLSTMHGCPPDEIERIAKYLLEERGLHTVVKLNPTLLGKERVLSILHDSLGFTEIHIPDAVFEKDLAYDKAVELIRTLQGVAAARGLTFGVKLSNTLAMHNHRGVLPGDEMYMSGRALYPVTMNLFARLVREFNGDPSTESTLGLSKCSGQGLKVSYSAGADAWNVATILSCAALPVTACSDLLKPGGYARFGQWLENLATEMQARGAASLDDLARDRLANVERAAAEALEDPRYKKHAFPYGLPKVKSGLGLWDCIVAPCVEACAVEQDVPEYAWLIAQGEYDRALEVILARNPLPGVTGYVCTHLCQTKCTRNDYEEPVAIRALKRVAAERGKVGYKANQRITNGETEHASHKVAIIGSGPSGLAAAAFLAVNGVQATIFEARDVPGGMLRLVPPFRLPWAIIQEDIDRITALGVEIVLNHPITVPPEELLKQGFDAVYVASGFQRDTPLRISGIEGAGVIPALHLLDRSRRGERVDLGRKAVVIGGGDTAMDAARTARRLTGHPATILYRRTRHEMPAAEEELEGVLEEGNLLEELVSPVRVIRQDGRVVGIECVRNRLGDPGPDGRRQPLPIPGSEFTVETDAVIVAVGQLPELTFLAGSAVTRHQGGGIVVDPETRCAGPEGVYAGGDVVIKPGSIIEACADGRAAAEAICERLCVPFEQPASRPADLTEEEILAVKRVRGRKVALVRPAMLPVQQRTAFQLIESAYTDEEARAEALRCLQCTTFCDKCVEVCPNRANLTCPIQAVRWTLPQLICRDGVLAVAGSEPFVVAQNRQILHLDDWCNECDNCQTFCVHRGKPYREKPRLFLEEADFQLEADNAFYVAGQTIRRREGGQEARLSAENGSLVYENAYVRLGLTPEFRVVEMTLKQAFEGTLSLREAAEMAVILTGVRESLPSLLV
jgi:putative selenate reductase